MKDMLENGGSDELSQMRASRKLDELVRDKKYPPDLLNLTGMAPKVVFIVRIRVQDI